MSPTTRYTRELAPGRAYVSIELTTSRGSLATYRIVLVAIHEGVEHTVRVYDNVHGVHEMHRHTLSGGKRPGEVVHYGEPAEASAAAERAITDAWEEMIAGWLR